MACTLLIFCLCVCVCASKRSDACGRRVRSLPASRSPKCRRRRFRYLFSSPPLVHLHSDDFSGLGIEEELLASLWQEQNGPQELVPRCTLKEEWQSHIILLSYFFGLLAYVWPHYLLYPPSHLFYSCPLHLCSSHRLLVCSSLVLITLITSLTLLSFAVGGESE